MDRIHKWNLFRDHLWPDSGRRKINITILGPKAGVLRLKAEGGRVVADAPKLTSWAWPGFRSLGPQCLWLDSESILRRGASLWGLGIDLG